MNKKIKKWLLSGSTVSIAYLASGCLFGSLFRGNPNVANLHVAYINPPIRSVNTPRTGTSVSDATAV